MNLLVFISILGYNDNLNAMELNHCSVMYGKVGMIAPNTNIHELNFGNNKPTTIEDMCTIPIINDS